jgi:hypothetical protein
MLADETGQHFTRISRIENGIQPPTDRNIQDWCTACGAEDQIPDLIATAQVVESEYLDWARQSRAGGGAGQGEPGLGWRRRAGRAGTTFPATARPAGITTSLPSLVRTVKDPASACSRMPSTSVICLLSAGPGRQRITTRWPTSVRVSRTSSRYRMPVTC